MKIDAFKVEEWMNAWETKCKYNIAETCCDSVSLNELFELAGEDVGSFLTDFAAGRLTYGYIEGNPKMKDAICELYKTIKSDEIVPTHGAAGANHHVFYSLIEEGDEVVSIMPTYQQLYSIPESMGAKVNLLHLKEENGYLPDLKELEALVTPKTKVICINNPNNPTGALMSEELLKQIVEIAKSVDAYVLCDEVYRHLTQEDIWTTSIVDLYEKGISVSSMSKVFSLAGIRMGWIASHDQAFIRSCWSHRDYNLVSCGIFDELVATVALTHKEALLIRNKALVRENLAILDKWVSENPLVHYVKPQAGTTALVYYDLDIPAEDFCKGLLAENGTMVTPGSCFEIEHSIRIGYAGDTGELKEGLAKLTEYLGKVAE